MAQATVGALMPELPMPMVASKSPCNPVQITFYKAPTQTLKHHHQSPLPDMMFKVSVAGWYGFQKLPLLSVFQLLQVQLCAKVPLL